MSSQRPSINIELLNRIRAAVGELKDADRIVDTLLEANVDLRVRPTVEEMKQILAEAYISHSCKTATN